MALYLPQDTNIMETNLRYIIFVIDSKYKQHDGKIFTSLSDAREFAKDLMEEEWNKGCKAVIGTFLFEPHIRDMYISQIETIGFAGDKKKKEQLDLFA